MVQFLLSVVIIFIIFIQAINGEVQKYSCEIVKNVDYYNDFLITNVCVLEGLNLTLTKKHFQPVASQPFHEVVAVYFKNSKLEVLTDDLCETFPLVKVFDAYKLSLTSVDENAFSKCTKLEIVYLYHNSLTTLPPKIFYQNEELTKVDLSLNKLTSIDGNLFKNNKKLTVVALNNNYFHFLPTNLFKLVPNLRELNVRANQLIEVSFLDQMPTLKSMTSIFLSYNKLSDVDVENLHKEFPNLKTLWLHENEF